MFTNNASSSREEAKAYTSAVLGLVEGRDPFEILAGTGSELRRLTAELSPSQLGQPEAPGKWSIRQILRHLADSEIVWGWRLRLVLGQERPSLTGYDQDAWAENLNYADADPYESIAIFDVLRGVHLQMLCSLPADALTRIGVHSERGEESVAHMIKLYAGHDILHLRQIERVKARLA